MSTPLPYVCSRCLRASRQLPGANALTRRTYHASPAMLSRHQNTGSSTAQTSTEPPYRQLGQARYMSTTARRLKPSLENQTAASGNATPPPPSPAAPPSTTASSLSKAQYTTTTLLNPRYDEETGEKMSIALTPRATKRLKQIMTKDSNPNLCLRVTVESGGCHGFQYLMSLEDISKLDESEDVLFVGSAPDAAVPAVEGGSWRVVAEGRPKVVIDESSLELLRGSNVDYTMELIGSQFKIDNPRASSSCGCGTSFDVKI